ncbi:hypothetical protein [Streptomyces purpureus]|uniref:Uncharacterized protein n=1 Tax=Streptomyces purpureus TaxID=1951 RepID=A0A918GZA6_9ACTN|nr:hypothetical protein [Streptomyces purpureus]GGT25779.1 hypothetical protein GCM10014713_18500 [Streptomyces purpureus]
MVTRRRGSEGRYGRWLLLVALLFGIVTMHTLGHPSAHGSDHGTSHGPQGPTAEAGAHRPATPDFHGSHEPPAEAVHVPAPAPAAANAADHAAPSTSHGGEGQGFDPASVCLAVLGALGVALLIVRLVVRRSGTALVVVDGRRLRALWPIPPPPRTHLTLLSVLRI